MAKRRFIVEVDYDDQNIKSEELMRMLSDFHDYIENERGCRYDCFDEKVDE